MELESQRIDTRLNELKDLWTLEKAIFGKGAKQTNERISITGQAGGTNMLGVRRQF